MQASTDLARPLAVTDLLDVVGTAVAAVSRRLPAHVDREDLASAGYLALVQAFPNAPSVEAEARAYLLRRVAGALRDELRKTDGAGRRTRKLLRAMKAASSFLENRLGRAPTVAELAAALEISAASIRSALARAEASTPVSDGESALSLVVAEDSSPADEAANSENADHVLSFLEFLSANERRVIVRTVLENLTLEVVGTEMGITKARVGQLRTAALKRLRANPALAKLWGEIGG